MTVAQELSPLEERAIDSWHLKRKFLLFMIFLAIRARVIPCLGFLKLKDVESMKNHLDL